MNQLAISQLLDVARNGDKKAEEHVFGYLYDRFIVFATHKIGNQESHDIAMLACKVVLEKYKTQVFTRGFEEWSYGVLRNIIKNHLRGRALRDRVMVSFDDSSTEPGASPERSYELKLLLLDCLKKMANVNPRYAKVLNMAFQGYHCCEIAQALNVRTDNVYVLLNRSRALLKEYLEQGGYDFVALHRP